MFILFMLLAPTEAVLEEDWLCLAALLVMDSAICCTKELLLELLLLGVLPQP
jgi:hypothetical protein